MAYLFLANNLRYMVNKVRGSQLKDLLGDEWVSRHEYKLRSYTWSYERLAWGKVLTAASTSKLTDAVEAREAMRLFNEAFTDACREQVAWIVPDRKMRDELKLSVARKLIPAYKNLYVIAMSAAGLDLNSFIKGWGRSGGFKRLGRSGVPGKGWGTS